MHIYSLLKTLCSKTFYRKYWKCFLLLTFPYCPLWGRGKARAEGGKKHNLILKFIASPKKLSLRRPWHAILKTHSIGEYNHFCPVIYNDVAITHYLLLTLNVSFFLYICALHIIYASRKKNYGTSTMWWNKYGQCYYVKYNWQVNISFVFFFGFVYLIVVSRKYVWIKI
jgi:hypothetical protein